MAIECTKHHLREVFARCIWAPIPLALVHAGDLSEYHFASGGLHFAQTC